jgi:hypothetical protein
LESKVVPSGLHLLVESDCSGMVLHSEVRAFLLTAAEVFTSKHLSIFFG